MHNNRKLSQKAKLKNGTKPELLLFNIDFT